MSDYDNFEKLFCGATWTVVKDENLQQLLDHSGASAEERKMTDMKPSFSFTREGDVIKGTIIMGPGMSFDYSFSFGKEFEFKDKPENPSMHSKLLCTFKDGMMTELNASQLPNASKPMVTEFTIKGDQLITTSYVKGDPSIKGIRYHARS